MLIVGNQKQKKGIDLNQYFLDNLKGELDEKEAKLSLIKFLRHNLRFSAEFICGQTLYDYQEILLRTWFKRNYNLNIISRGGAKSFMAAMFCALYPIFNPGARIVLVSSTFRTSRRIFEQLQKFVADKDATLLKQCFAPKPERRNDAWTWTCNGGFITALPLGAGAAKIRGTRADILIIDEFLLISKEIYEQVLMPFLVAKGNVKEQERLNQIENQLIKQGKMKEEDRTILDAGKKLILLSSAGFKFEYMFKGIYEPWIENVMNGDQKTLYSIMQMSWEALPKSLIDEDVVEAAQSGGSSNAAFMREYCAIFTDDSDSYFSAKKMEECTITDGELPTIELEGDKNSEYIVSIDPSFSSSKSSDDFAMAVIKLNPQTKTGTLVHNYAVAGGNLKDHVAYAHYIFTHFNIVYVIGDSAGTEQFIESCNMSLEFKNLGIELKTFNADFNNNEDYVKKLRDARLSYNLTTKKIVQVQQFNPNTIRMMNELLQASIDHKKIFFASSAMNNELVFSKYMAMDLPDHVLDVTYNKSKKIGESLTKSLEDKKYDFVDYQGFLMNLTKKECTLIEVSSSASTGNQTFDLPQYLRRSKEANKARRDSYTTLLLGNFAIKCYYNMMDTPIETASATFAPTMY